MIGASLQKAAKPPNRAAKPGGFQFSFSTVFSRSYGFAAFAAREDGLSRQATQASKD